MRLHSQPCRLCVSITLHCGAIASSNWLTPLNFLGKSHSRSYFWNPFTPKFSHPLYSINSSRQGPSGLYSTAEHICQQTLLLDAIQDPSPAVDIVWIGTIEIQQETGGKLAWCACDKAGLFKQGSEHSCCGRPMQRVFLICWRKITPIFSLKYYEPSTHWNVLH